MIHSTSSASKLTPQLLNNTLSVVTRALCLGFGLHLSQAVLGSLDSAIGIPDVPISNDALISIYSGTRGTDMEYLSPACFSVISINAF